MPDGSLAWIAYEATLGVSQSIEHGHEFAFVYAVEGTLRLELWDYDRSLPSGEWGAVSAGAIHRHEVSQGQSVFWEARLADPASHSPSNLPMPILVFESDVL